MAKGNKLEKLDDGIDERETVQEIPLSEIHADFSWNVRKSLDVAEGSTSTNVNTLKSLRDSIESGGQDIPVIVRPAPHGSPKGTKYSLVAGFRRFAAISAIASDNKVAPKDATIKAVVRMLSELEARTLNIRENTSRENLSERDLMQGVMHLKTLQPGLTQVTIANVLGITQGYVSKIFAVNGYNNGSKRDSGASVDPTIREMWRNNEAQKDGKTVTASNPLSLDKMYALSKKPVAEQIVEYNKLAIAEKTPRGPDSWIESVAADVRKMGAKLGRCVKRGGLAPVNDGFWTLHLGVMVESLPAVGDKKGKGKEVTADQVAHFASEAQKAYKQALTAPEPEPKAKKEKASEASAN